MARETGEFFNGAANRILEQPAAWATCWGVAVRRGGRAAHARIPDGHTGFLLGDPEGGRQPSARKSVIVGRADLFTKPGDAGGDLQLARIQRTGGMEFWLLNSCLTAAIATTRPAIRPRKIPARAEVRSENVPARDKTFGEFAS